MYVRVLQDELQFPDDRTMDQDTKSLLRGVSGLPFPFV
jgi:serum/glucocorticoid-regulated kinase 2